MSVFATGIARAAAAAALVGLAACGGAKDAAAPATSLVGAGATFPNPIYSKWFDQYARTTGVQINYQSIGSGGGIRQYTEGTVDFGATDGPMTDEQIAAVGGNVFHAPTVLGAVVLTYNLPQLADTPLRLDGATVADVFLGRIQRWNDRRLAQLNPGLTLPDLPIVVVHRSDGSGTTFVFTDYLAKVSAAWQEQAGVGTAVQWPVGLGGKGNEGVTQQVKQLEGAIGYVELIYAQSNGLPYAALRNEAGNYVSPSLASVTAAAASAVFAPETDFRVSITNAPGADAYPIASFTWLLVRPTNPEAGKAKTIKQFLTWMVSPEAQGMASEAGYAPLPQQVVDLLKPRIEALRTDPAPQS